MSDRPVREAVNARLAASATTPRISYSPASSSFAMPAAAFVMPFRMLVASGSVDSDISRTNSLLRYATKKAALRRRITASGVGAPLGASDCNSLSGMAATKLRNDSGVMRPSSVRLMPAMSSRLASVRACSTGDNPRMPGVLLKSPMFLGTFPGSIRRTSTGDFIAAMISGDTPCVVCAASSPSR